MGSERRDSVDVAYADSRLWMAVAVVFLVSFALLSAQITVTRLLAYRFFYHFVFFVISLAQLGLAGAGAWIYASRKFRPSLTATAPWVLLVAVMPLVVLACYAWLSPEPNLSMAKVDGPSAYGYLLVLAVGLLTFNFCGGMVLAILFTTHRERFGLLYGGDLLGAALGCLAAVGLMAVMGPIQGFLVSGLAAAAAGLLMHRVTGERLLRWGAPAVFLGLVGIIPFAPQLFDPNVRHGDFGGQILRSQWTHIARVDALQPSVYIIDGDASTSLGHLSDPHNAPEYELVVSDPDVAIIGAGAGPQLRVALARGANSVLANDINPTIIGWDLNEDSAANGEIFHAPPVDIVIGEGRHVLRSSERQFDLIVMHAIDTWTASAQGAYSLTENFLYTREAFSDFLSRLKPNGVMSVRRWLFWPPRENLRLFTTVIEALRDSDVNDPAQHVVVLAPTRDYRRVDLKIWGYLLFSADPLTEERLAALDIFVDSRDWEYLYRPGAELDTPFAKYLEATGNLQGFYSDYPYNVSPASDANPFFFQYTMPWSGRFDDRLSHVIYSQSMNVLLLCTAACIVLTVLVLGIPLFLRRRDLAGDHQRGATLLYFGSLGVGFMAFELPVIQAMTLFLGHPTYALSVVLLGLLSAAGLGSLIMDRSSTRTGQFAIVAVMSLGLLFAWGLLAGVHALIYLPDFARFALALICLLVLGVALGMPFVAGVKLLDPGIHKVPWAWAANGAAGVVGSCLVMMVMIMAGSRVSLVLAAACYALAFLGYRRLGTTREHSNHRVDPFG